jgi:nucleotide-binding universal stress UspA family protein
MFERILLAVNQSESSRKAADVAADIAQKYGAEVVVLHILERHMAKFGGYEFEQPKGGAELVDGIVRAMKDAGVSARGEIQTAASGSIPRAILESAREQDANLIVLGSRRLSDWDELLLKSVSHRVLHLPGCPVVVVVR